MQYIVILTLCDVDCKHIVKVMYYYSTVNSVLLFLLHFIITYCYYALYQIRMKCNKYKCNSPNVNIYNFVKLVTFHYFLTSKHLFLYVFAIFTRLTCHEVENPFAFPDITVQIVHTMLNSFLDNQCSTIYA